MKSTRLGLKSVALLCLACAGLILSADDEKSPAKSSSSSSSGSRETIAKPISEKEKKKRDEKLRKELETPYKKWLDEDVRWIITDEERTTFKRLSTDEERENFIEDFWRRRDPTPDTEENEFKEEHYRRIQYANDHFASGIPGWKTDRGRIYIVFGPPDERDEHPTGGTYERPPEEGGGETTTFPFEDWRYRYIDGIGNNVMIEFVDPTMTGEYRLTMDPSEKDALTYVPGAGLSLMEQLGLSDKMARFNRTDGTHSPMPMGGNTAATNEFDRLDQYVKLQKAPGVKFKDLEAEVNSRITYNILPMTAVVDYFPVTEGSVMTSITLQFNNKDLNFQSKEGVNKAVVNIYGRVTTITRKVVQVFEDTVDVPAAPEMLEAMRKVRSVYQKNLFLVPNTYRLNVVAKDVVGGSQVNYEVALRVPAMDSDKLTTSSLVLADILESVPTKSIGSGPFVIGNSKVRPRVDNTFKRDEPLNIYLKVYNFEGDQKTQKPVGQVEYQVFKKGETTPVPGFQLTEDLSQIPQATASQVILKKRLSLKDLPPGQYEIRVKVTDKNRNQVLTPSAQFTVT